MSRSKNLKIVSVVLFCFFFVTLSVYFVNEWYRSQYDVEKFQELWYSRPISTDKNQIFLMGSSHVVRLMPSQIQEILYKEGMDYEVYNLGFPGDSHASKLDYVDKMISLKPKIIVFGIGYRDFQTKTCSVTLSNNESNNNLILNMLISPPQFFHNLFQLKTNDLFDIKNFGNPKFTSLQIFQILQGKSIVKTPDLDSNRPFKFVGDDLQMKPASYEELQTYVKKHPFDSCVNPSSQNVSALKEIIQKLQENNIKVILFTTPHHQLFLDDLSESNKESFISILENISEETGIKVYFLHEKYSDLDIWSDPTHITVNSNSLIYSDDVAKIILTEVKD